MCGSARRSLFQMYILGSLLGQNTVLLVFGTLYLKGLEGGLQCGKGITFLRGGRLVLIKSTLQNMSVFMLSTRIVPVTVLEEIERLIRKFLWGTTEGRRKYHLVAFEGFCLPFDLGGLGLEYVKSMCHYYVNGFGG